MSRATKVGCWLLPWLPILGLATVVADAYNRHHPGSILTTDNDNLYDVMTILFPVAALLFLFALILLTYSFVKFLRRRIASV